MQGLAEGGWYFRVVFFANMYACWAATVPLIANDPVIELSSKPIIFGHGSSAIDAINMVRQKISTISAIVDPP